MAWNSISLLVLLLAFCFLLLTLARNLDIPENSNIESSPARIAKKQGHPLLSSAETGHVKGVSVSSVLYHETGHGESTLTHGTGRAENIILKSALHPQPEFIFNDKIMSPASISHKEEMSSSSFRRADDIPFSQDEFLLPILSHSEDILLHESELFLHDDDTIASYLAQNGLPIGLVPSSVASYSITNDGEFMISLQKACYAKFDYEVYYAQTITGKLSYGTITNLSGIQAKEAFFWVSVTGVHTDVTSSEYIYFDAGPISKKLSISQFQTIPVCKVKAMTSSALA